MRPVIVEILASTAVPFTAAYCSDYGIPFDGDPNFGKTVIWLGAHHEGTIRAVLGLVIIPEGLYILGLYNDKTPAGVRAIMALNRWMYDLQMPLWAHIREDNPRMWNRALKDGAQIIGSTENRELLMHFPSKRSLKCDKMIEVNTPVGV